MNSVQDKKLLKCEIEKFLLLLINLGTWTKVKGVNNPDWWRKSQIAFRKSSS